MCIVSTSNLFEIAALHCCFQRRLILCGQAMRCCRSFRMVELCPTKTKAYSVWCILDDSLAQCSWSHENIKVCWATFENLEIGIITLCHSRFWCLSRCDLPWPLRKNNDGGWNQWNQWRGRWCVPAGGLAQIRQHDLLKWGVDGSYWDLYRYLQFWVTQMVAVYW